MSWHLRKIWAFLARDYRQDTSYKLNFVSQWTAILLNILVWYFLARFMGDLLTERLAVYGGDFFSFLLIGVAFWGYQSTAVSALRSRIREAQTQGTLEALLVTRTSPNLIIIGSIVYDFVFMSIRVVAYLLVGYALFGLRFDEPNYGGALVVMLFSIAAFLGIGIGTAAFTMVFKKGDPATWIFTSLSVPLGGVLYPVSSLPESVQVISNLLPVTHSIEALRRTLLDSATLSDVRGSLFALALFAAIMLPASLLLFRRSLRWAKAAGSLVKF